MTDSAYSPYAYMLLNTASGVAMTLLGVWAYRRRASADVETRKAGSVVDLNAKERDLELAMKAREGELLEKARAAALEAQRVPIQLLKEELAKREKELAEVRAKDDAERAKYLETLIAIRGTMEAIAKNLNEHREEERHRSHNTHLHLDRVKQRLTIIETKLGLPPETEDI